MVASYRAECREDILHKDEIVLVTEVKYRDNALNPIMMLFAASTHPRGHRKSPARM